MIDRLERFLSQRSAWVERELERLLKASGPAPIPFLAPAPALLRKAMGYSLMAGGKRLRPALVLEAAACCGLPRAQALGAACALEMIHTYSLIHDDLPAMDDDDLRRGKPTNHKVFGEAMAILAGDGLLTKAFEAAAENAADNKLKGREAAELVRLIAYGAGGEGMVGGQVADLAAEGMSKKISKASAAKVLEAVHRRKTGALIIASLDAGAVLAGASEAKRDALRSYGECVGLAFQIADDVLDVTATSDELGKTAGKDLAFQKSTYPALLGVDGAIARAEALVEEGCAALAEAGVLTPSLEATARYIVARRS